MLTAKLQLKLKGEVLFATKWPHLEHFKISIAAVDKEFTTKSTNADKRQQEEHKRIFL